MHVDINIYFILSKFFTKSGVRDGKFVAGNSWVTVHVDTSTLCVARRGDRFEAGLVLRGVEREDDAPEAKGYSQPQRVFKNAGGTRRC